MLINYYKYIIYYRYKLKYINLLTEWSNDVSVINLKKSSQPDVTDATELSISVSLPIACFSFSRNSDKVSAKIYKL